MTIAHGAEGGRQSDTATDGSPSPKAGAAPLVLPPIPRPEDRRQAGGGLALAAALVGVQVYLAFFVWYAANEPYQLWGGFLIAPILFIVTVPFLRRGLEKVEGDPLIRRLIILGLAAKLIGAFARFFAGEYLIGHADAVVYSAIGTNLSAEFRSFVFDGPALDFHTSRGGQGTIFIRIFTGALYSIMKPSVTAGYVVYSYLSFWGLYFFYRAYSIAVPDGLRRRYVALLFFLPSMVFWPSSIGKEAWMTMALGIGAYGVARLIQFRRFGYATIALSCLLMAMVRPHVAAIFATGLAGAVILRRAGEGSNASVKRIFGLVVMGVLALVLLNRLQSFFGVDAGLDFGEVLEETSERSSTGGSEFSPISPTSPVGLVWAIVTSLFRPFLFEANNSAAAVAALEGTFLLGLFTWSAARLARLPAAMFSRPYVGFAVLYTIAFAFAFAAIANFGILARQRTQLIPVAVVLVTIPVEPLLMTRGDLQRSEPATPAPPPLES